MAQTSAWQLRLDVPLGSKLASLDINGRYVFMGKQNGLLTSFDALGGNFWTVSVGLGSRSR